MAKFYLASDLHLEFGDLVIENKDSVDCLILAGDVVEIDQLKKDGETKKPWIADFFRRISRDFPKIVWIPGNHEYYGCYYMEKSFDFAKDWLKMNYLDNIHLVDMETVEVSGIPLHCATLWTNMNRGNAWIAHVAQNGMNDYRSIRGPTPLRAGNRLNSTDTQVFHGKALKFLDKATSDKKDCIVVTHHQPTLLALTSEYKSDLDYAYASDLSEFFLDRTNIKVWCSGHTHSSMQTITFGADETEQKFLTNCRGYAGHESIANMFEPMLFEM